MYKHTEDKNQYELQEYLESVILQKENKLHTRTHMTGCKLQKFKTSYTMNRKGWRTVNG